MGEATAEVITEIVVAVVVSEVASSIAEKIGLSDSMADLVGIGAAAYVGAARAQEEPHPIFGGGTGTGAAGSVLDAGLPSLEQQKTSGPVAPSDVAPSGAPDDIGMRTGEGTLPAGGAASGLLTQGQATPGTVNQGANVVPSVETPKVQSDTVGRTPPPEEGSYWSKLFSPERTMDMLLAGIGGAAKSKEIEEDREYPEKVAKANAAGWVSAGTENLGKLKQTFPGQGYLSQYQQ